MLRLIWALCFFGAVSAFAHPHVFVDVSLKVVFDESGFGIIQNHWVYDELYSAAMMASGDRDGDGQISPSENSWFRDAILTPLKESNYCNYVLQGTLFLKADELKNFKATFKNNRLILDFEIKFSSPASADYTMLVLAVADPSNYIQMTAGMEQAEVDGPESLDVEFFDDSLQGLTLFRAFPSNVEGLYLRYKLK